MWICKYCQTENHDDEGRFCGCCGKRRENEQYSNSGNTGSSNVYTEYRNETDSFSTGNNSNKRHEPNDTGHKRQRLIIAVVVLALACAAMLCVLLIGRGKADKEQSNVKLNTQTEQTHKKAEEKPANKPDWKQPAYHYQELDADMWHSAWLNGDGTVRAMGKNDFGQCSVSDWEDIVSVDVGTSHTVGLKSDGTVVATGANFYGQCDVSGWRNVVAVSAASDYTVALKSDGTVIAQGHDYNGQFDVDDWRDIVAISAGDYNILGLRSDGSCVLSGTDDHGNAGKVSEWTNVRKISAGIMCFAGLCDDGSVVVSASYMSTDASSWTNITDIAIGGSHLLGITRDGDVQVACSDKNDPMRMDAESWSNVESVAVGSYYTLNAIGKDGTVLCTGYDDENELYKDFLRKYGQPDAGDDEYIYYFDMEAYDVMVPVERFFGPTENGDFFGNGGSYTYFMFDTVEDCTFFAVPIKIESSEGRNLSSVKWGSAFHVADEDQWYLFEEYEVVDGDYSMAWMESPYGMDIDAVTVLPVNGEDVGGFFVYASFAQSQLAFSDEYAANSFADSLGVESRQRVVA